MSKILFIGSTLTLGAGAGAGGLAIKTLKSGSQVSYQTVSSDNNSEEKEVLEEQGEDSDVDLKSQGEASQDKGEHYSQVQQHQEAVSSQDSGVSHSQSSPERSSEPAKEKCNVYTVISSSSGNRKARLESESFVKNHVKDPSVVKKIEEACEKSKKAYIANPRGGRGWTYRPEDQLGYWKIENNS